MAIDQTHAAATGRHTRRAVPERVIASLVCDSYDADLRTRVDDAMERHLAVFFAIQSVPSRTVRQAA